MEYQVPLVLMASEHQEVEFMYKPGNMSRPPPIVTPHQPRLDWQMWFAALGPHTQSPWFTSLVHRLLQGKEPGVIPGGLPVKGGALWMGHGHWEAGATGCGLVGGA